MHMYSFEARKQIQSCSDVYADFFCASILVHRAGVLPKSQRKLHSNSVDFPINMSVQQKSTPGAGGEPLRYEVVTIKVISTTHKRHFA